MQFKAGEEAEIRKRISRSAKFQRVFSGAEGEYVLKEIDDSTGYKSNTFDPDPYLNAYKSGQRSMAVFLHNVLDQDTETAIRILDKEKKDEV